VALVDRLAVVWQKLGMLTLELQFFPALLDLGVCLILFVFFPPSGEASQEAGTAY
jgi:hypothetical protein